VPALLVVLLVVVPLVELYVLIQVGSVIGAPLTILLLLLDGVLGAWLLRREGRRTWAAFRTATAQGAVPAREVADGALVLLGGALMLTPGFVTDIVGVLCVLPPTRALLRRRLTAYVGRRLLVPRPPGRGSGTVDGEVVDP
jgi:UPF0716 protein FxsA